MKMNDNEILFLVEPRMGMVREVSNEFLNMTEYTRDEIISNEVSYIFIKLLKLSNDLYEKLCLENKLDCFIFTKTLDVREVTIYITQDSELDQTRYYIKEIPNSRLESKLLLVEKLIKDNHKGIGIFACPDLRLIRANLKYFDYMDDHFSRREDILGCSLRLYSRL